MEFAPRLVAIPAVWRNIMESDICQSGSLSERGCINSVVLYVRIDVIHPAQYLNSDARLIYSYPVM